MSIFKQKSTQPTSGGPVGRSLVRAYYLIPAPVLPAIVVVPVDSREGRALPSSSRDRTRIL